MKSELGEWRDIEGYEGLYQVSSLGEVRSMDRIVKSKGDLMQRIRGRIIKPTIQRKGRCSIALHKDGQLKNYMVHRLVAKAFIPNDDPENKTQVNHKDENQSNNRVDNLEWCDAKYNINYGTGRARMAEKLINGKNSRPVLQYTLDGEFVREWPSTMEIERQLGIFNTQISACCLKRYGFKSAGGYMWQYAENNKEIV